MGGQSSQLVKYPITLIEGGFELLGDYVNYYARFLRHNLEYDTVVFISADEGRAIQSTR